MQDSRRRSYKTGKMREIQFIQIETDDQIKKAAETAEKIWTEHYTPIIGVEQTKYMIKKFQSEKAISDQIKNSGYLYYLIVFDEKISGYLALVRMENVMFLSKIYVEKSFRGVGISRKAVEFVKNLCKKEGCEKIFLTVNKQNHSSIAVYEHLGFVKVREEVTDIGEGYFMDDFIMEVII